MHRDDLLDLNAAGDALGVSRTILYRMIAEGDLAAIRHGRRLFVEPDEIDAYWQRRRDEANRLRIHRAERAAAASTVDTEHTEADDYDADYEVVDYEAVDYEADDTPGESRRRPRAAASRDQPAA